MRAGREAGLAGKDEGFSELEEGIEIRQTHGWVAIKGMAFS